MVNANDATIIVPPPPINQEEKIGIWKFKKFGSFDDSKHLELRHKDYLDLYLSTKVTLTCSSLMPFIRAFRYQYVK